MHPTDMMAFAFAMLGTSSVLATDIGLCTKLPFGPGESRIVLEGSQVGPNADFIGTFRVHNLSRKSDLTLEGRLIDGLLRLEQPQRMIEYADVYDTWQRTLELVRDPGPRPDRIVIRPGESARFSAPLISEELANKGARKLRLTVIASDPNRCMVSEVFVAHPVPLKVKGFATVTASAVGGQSKGDDKAD